MNSRLFARTASTVAGSLSCAGRTGHIGNASVTFENTLSSIDTSYVIG
ncbi:hypothetical protein ACPCB7_13990 [Streptomyces arboris]